MRSALSQKYVGLALVALCATGTGARADDARIGFVDRASGQDFRHTYTGGWEHFVGGGVAAFDCNGDGFLDLYVAGGTTQAKLLINDVKDAGDPLTFRLQPAAATDLAGVIGAYPLDIDGDGFLDLAVLRVGENVLLRGLGGCAFTRANEAWGFVGGDSWTTAFSATWEPGAAWPTLAFGNYVDRTDPERRCDASFAYRPQARGYGDPVPLEPSRCPLSMLFTDWNGSGRADLRVSNDRHYYGQEGQEQLWRFGTEPRLYSEAEGWRPLKIWGMGIAARDLTGDSRPEYLLTSMGDQKLRVLAEDATGPAFVDAAYDLGVTAHVPHVGPNNLPSTGWHPAFGDINNDGMDDLFITKGNVNAMPDAAADDPNNLLIRQRDGRFLELSELAGVASVAQSRGGAMVDLNRDGRLDLVVVNREANLEILENRTEGGGNWLAIDVAQSNGNWRAVGATIEVSDGQRTWHRQVIIGGGHASGYAGPEHFGLGLATDVRVRVHWPDGSVSPWKRTEANRQVSLRK